MPQVIAQMNGLRQQIAELTKELVPGQTSAREEAIRDQIRNMSDQLESIQQQHNQLVTGQQVIPQEGQPWRENGRNPNDIPDGVQRVIENGMVFAAVVILGYPLIRLIARRLEPRPKVDNSELSPRLDRLEQGMEAVAIEVERISEGQRFTNKLLSEQRALPAPNPMDQWAAARPKVEEKIERR